MVARAFPGAICPLLHVAWRGTRTIGKSHGETQGAIPAGMHIGQEHTHYKLGMHERGGCAPDLAGAQGAVPIHARAMQRRVAPVTRRIQQLNGLIGFIVRLASVA